jgi:peptide/nickel transport system permease protein
MTLLQPVATGADWTPAGREPPGRAATVRRRRRVGWGASFGVAWLAGLAIAATGASALPFSDPLATDVLHRQIAPGTEFWLGTDQIGRDMLARVVFGARLSLTVAVCASLIPAALGTLFGLLAGYFRGRLETFTLVIADIILAFPGIILALLVTAYAGATLLNLILVLGFLGIPIYTRIARATTLEFAQREFVLAARVLGATHSRIMRRELLPNIIVPVGVVVVLGMSQIGRAHV